MLGRGADMSPTIAGRLVFVNKVLTAIGYTAYPLLLILLAMFDRALLLRCIVVPAVSFVAVSVFRYFYDAPRPYDISDVEPIIKKETHGKSFPSRHTFCMFMIAASWFVWQPVVGLVLGVCAIVMAVVRVAGGVHFPRDVIAGAVIAIAFAAIGYGLIG